MSKVVLITGASRGIGRAISLKFAKEGFDVAINFSSKEEEVLDVKKACEAFGVRAEIYRADVSSMDEALAMVKNVQADLGDVDVLVNNAGITRDGLLMMMKEQDFDRVMDVNAKGVFNMCKALVRSFMKRRSGAIVNVASVVGLTGNMGQLNYSASKGAVISMTKSLAKELSSRNIRVNAVAPGFIETEMTEKLDDSVKDAMLSAIPLGRFGRPEDVADVCFFLAEDSARYITGQVITVDGGMVM